METITITLTRDEAYELIMASERLLQTYHDYGKHAKPKKLIEKVIHNKRELNRKLIEAYKKGFYK